MNWLFLSSLSSFEARGGREKECDSESLRRKRNVKKDDLWGRRKRIKLQTKTKSEKRRKEKRGQLWTMLIVFTNGRWFFWKGSSDWRKDEVEDGRWRKAKEEERGVQTKKREFTLSTEEYPPNQIKEERKKKRGEKKCESRRKKMMDLAPSVREQERVTLPRRRDFW